MVVKDINKKEFADRIATHMGVYKYQANNFLSAFQEVLEEAIFNGESIYLKDFITFDVIDIKQRDYLNPQNQELVKGYPKKRVKTKFCSRIQSILNEQAKENITDEKSK